MSKKVQVTLSDDMFDWLESEALNLSTRPATLASIYIGEARKRQQDKENMQVMFDKMRSITSDQFKDMLSTEFNQFMKLKNGTED